MPEGPWHLVLSKTIYHGPTMLMDVLDRAKFQGPFGIDHVLWTKCLRDFLDWTKCPLTIWGHLNNTDSWGLPEEFTKYMSLLTVFSLFPSPWWPGYISTFNWRPPFLVLHIYLWHQLIVTPGYVPILSEVTQLRPQMFDSLGFFLFLRSC